ncbi:MAG: tRNA pseudouridine(13) synthase TruD [Anaerolineae bacterium]|jgi:tRNA pseudouridine13 synthase
MSEAEASASRRTDHLPYITADLSGVGGAIKVEPADFVVEEIPLYEASGEGQHVYVRLTREGWTTRALERELAEIFNLRDVDVGCAGRKDKHARTTQTFSLSLPNVDGSTVGRRIEENLPVEVVWVQRHHNKIRAGHLLGNRFRILVRGPELDALPQAKAIGRALREQGLPNFYGPQRFGREGDNAERGRQILVTGRGPRKRWLRRLLLQAYQSALFNTWLVRRIEHGWFGRLLIGDVAKKRDTGGLFEVKDAQTERQRFERDEITYTGPIYGSRMWWAAGRPGELEREVLEEADVTEEMLDRANLSGSRRRASLLLDDLEVESHPDGLLLTFSLPKGSYATMVLREFMKQ